MDLLFPVPMNMFASAGASSREESVFRRQQNNAQGKETKMAKIVCVLYDDPVDGYPKTYARDDVPQPKVYPDGQTLPTPKAIDFKPGTLLGSVSGELGLRKFLESNGHQLIVTSS